MRVIVAVGLLSALSLGQFVNVTATAGINIPPTAGITSVYGRGAAWADFDGDGDLDVFAPGGCGQPITLHLNQGAAGFTAQTIQAALPTDQHHRACVAADFDNDGDKDVFVCVGNEISTVSTPNLLFVNDGTGSFTEEAAARGLLHVADSCTASWGDFDRDGWLDLYVGDYLDSSTPQQFSARVLYRNDGDGTFTDVTAGSGAGNLGWTLTAFWHDFDQDGWPDIVYGNDRGSVFTTALVTGMLRNNRDGTFTEVGPAINGDAPIDAMGGTVGDIDNDGDWDFFFSFFGPGHVLFLWDQATQSYDPGPGGIPYYFWGTTLWGVAAGQTGWGCSFFDYDANGFLDLYVQHAPGFNALYQGFGAPPFTNQSAASGVTTETAPDYGCCIVDYDNDGDLDIYQAGFNVAAQLVENTGPTGNWLMIETIGNVSNRDGLGSVIIAREGGNEQRREIVSGDSYLCDGDKRVHFGFGTATTVGEIEIRWPSGTVQYLHNVAVNQHLTVTEPSFQVTSGTLAPGTSSNLQLLPVDDVGLPYVCAMSVLPGEYYLADGRAIRVWINDPAIAFTTAPGNPFLAPATGTVPAGGIAPTLTIPGFPISGFGFNLIAVTVDPTYPSGIKSITGPQPFVVL